MFAVGRMSDFPVIYRPPTTDAETIRLAMDLGPCGLLLPMVNSAAQLDVVRDGIYLPPRGQRRPGGAGNRWVTGVNYDNWRQEVEDHLIILPQIESPEGLANVDAIAGHEITTHMASGPFDLAARLGVLWEPESPVLIEALIQVRQAAERHGKSLWTIGPPSMIQSVGLHFYAVAEPSALLEARLREVVAAARDQA
jgi:2-keto-3-deoxy-L-rhamnonate aldolase RhmA